MKKTFTGSADSGKVPAKIFKIEVGPFYLLITIKIYNQPRKFLKSEKLLATFWTTGELCGLEIGNLERYVFSMYMIQYHISSPTFIPQRKAPTWNVVCVVDWIKVKDYWLETKQNLKRGSGSGFRIRIRIHWPDWIRIQSGSGSGSETLLFTINDVTGWVPPLQTLKITIFWADSGWEPLKLSTGYMYKKNPQIEEYTVFRGFFYYSC